MDLTRVRVRLEGYSSYSVVSALIMNAALRLVTSTDLNLGDSELPIWLDKCLQATFLLSISTAVLGGSYCTVVFALCSAYAKTAIGLSLDDRCEVFLRMTHIYRLAAFRAFLAMLASFSISFPLSLFFRARGTSKWIQRIRWIILVTGVCLTLAMMSDWMTIISLATDHIYNGASLGVGRP